MFEKVLIRRADDTEFDIGTLAETVFFYGKTQLLISMPAIRKLTKIPRDDLLELSSRGCLNLSYVKPNFAVLSSGLIRVHKFVAFEHGPKQRKRISTFEEEISDEFVRSYGASPSTRKAANRFIDRVKLFHHPQFNNKANVVCELTKIDIGDPRFVRAAAAASLRQIAPSYQLPDNFHFEVLDTGDGFAVVSDLDFSAITKVCLPPFNESFTASHLLGFIQDARADTFFASHYMAELVTTGLSSEIIRLKHYDWLHRGDESRREISLFTDVATDKFRRRSCREIGRLPISLSCSIRPINLSLGCKRPIRIRGCLTRTLRRQLKVLGLIP
jgi:hypothetical protein